MVTAAHHPKHPAVNILVLATSLSWTATVQAQSTWFVDDDGPTQGGCMSWEDACPDLHAALGLADGGDEVRVARGTYTPAGPNGDRAATFQLLNGVVLLGGYLGLSAGKGEDPDDRNLELYETILSGDLNGDDGPDFENNDENSYHVVTGSGTDARAVLDGFTVTAGHADGEWPHDFGGGLYNTGSPTVRNCSFVGNWAVHGGGVHNAFGNPTMIDCYFAGNATAEWGGAIDNFSAAPTLVNCVLTGNTTAGEGGAMHSDLSSPTLTNCTISGNTADQGGGLFNYVGAIVTVTNCILWINSDSMGSIESSQLFNGASENDFIVNHTSVQGWTGEYGGVGNMGDDPLFVNSAASDFHLRPDSPSVDAGSNEALPEDINTDLDGNPRFIDGDDDGVAEVDMGAYEFQGGVPCPADLDGDGDVDAADLAQLLAAWGPTEPCPPFEAADLDQDCEVDAADLAELLSNWG